MPRKKTSTTPTRRAQASNISRLRKLGLTKSQAGKPGKRAGGSAYAVLKKFSPVLEGRAAVVSAKPSVAARYKGTFPTTRTKIVVPKSPGETVRLGRAGMITKKKTVIPGERSIRIQIPPSINSITDLPSGKGYRYRVNYGSSRILFDSLALLEDFLSNYEKGHKFNVGFIEVIPPAPRRHTRAQDRTREDYEFDGDEDI